MTDAAAPAAEPFNPKTHYKDRQGVVRELPPRLGGAPTPQQTATPQQQRPPVLGGERDWLGEVRWNNRVQRLTIWIRRGWAVVTRPVLEAVIYELRPPGDFLGNPVPGGTRIHLTNLSKDPEWRRCAAWQCNLQQLFGTKDENVDFEALAWSMWVQADRDVRQLDDVITAARFWAIANGRRPPHTRYAFAQYTS